MEKQQTSMSQRTQTLLLPRWHSWEQSVIYNALRTPGLQEAWFAMGTKFGKSISGGAGISGVSYEKPGEALFRWVAPVHRQAKIGLKYCQRILHKDLYDINKSDPSITLKHNKAVIEFMSGKTPENIEGEGVDGGYILDEFAKAHPDVYAAVKTTVTFTRAPIVGFSTPLGKNHFHTICMQAKDEMEWAIKKGRPPKKIFLTAPTASNPLVDRQVIIDAKRDLPERLFRQYYLAEFVDDGSVFVGLFDCVVGEPVELGGAIQTWFDPECSQSEVVIGADWAKKEDWTVFTAIDISTQKPALVGYKRFQGLSYIDAVKELWHFSQSFKRIHLVRHDRTGVGEAIQDLLVNLPLPIDGVVFTNSSKMSMVNKLMLSFQRGDLFLPNIRQVIDELEYFEVKTNSLGNASYSAPPGKHDDCVASLMLANSGVHEIKGNFEFRFLEDIHKCETPVEKWYRDMIEDDDNE